MLTAEGIKCLQRFKQPLVGSIKLKSIRIAAMRRRFINLLCALYKGAFVLLDIL